MDEHAAIAKRLRRALTADRRAARRELERLASADLDPVERARRLAVLRQRVERSCLRRRRREQGRPTATVPDELPIAARREQIVAAIRRHRVVVVSGETGSGKTTQLPKMCLAAGRGIHGTIGCTQPRRIAAVSVAQRIARELGEEVGGSVGYAVRFQDRSPRGVYIKLMTDGILLAEAQKDPLLRAYDTLIVDEAHERSLNIDFILGLLRNLLRRRRDLKLIVTSATIDTAKFASAFNDAPVIEVSGRLYPVTIDYLSEAEAAEDRTPVERAMVAVERLPRRGDVLVFMPTERDIRDTCDLLAERRWPATTVLPLFARLTAAEQARVFGSTGGRKIVVATNIAETSVTIPGIRYVVDTGLARIARYQPRTRTTALPVVPVSRSAADQRAGRCGRVAAGVCRRLYTAADYAARPRFTPPEIQRANLAEVILRMLALRLGDIATFPFLDPPDPRSVRDGIALLEELGALTVVSEERRRGDLRLTERGRLMARIPLDPRLARMLLKAHARGCLAAVQVLAAVLSVSDPRERPAEQAAAADAAQRCFVDPRSDFVTLLNLWQAAWHAQAGRRAAGRLRAFCRTHFLSFGRMREWADIHAQVGAVLGECGLEPPPAEQAAAQLDAVCTWRAAAPAEAPANVPGIDDPDYAAVHICLLSGFLSNIAVKREKNLFSATRGREVMVFPGSGLFNRAGEWLLAAEMVHTSRLFARTCAAIDSRWIEPLAAGLCRAAYSNPRWSKRQGRVVATEQVTLFGLLIVADRTVAYGPVNPGEAGEIFARQALVEGELSPEPPFRAHNRRLEARVADMEARLRRRDILAPPEVRARFYLERLAGVCDLRALAALIRRRGGDCFLRMRLDDVALQPPSDEVLASFPDAITVNGHALACRYAFDPAGKDDGVTVRVPAALAPLIPPAALEWLVPGLLPEKIARLIRQLPKSLRRRLVPAADAAARIAAELSPGEGSLAAALSRAACRCFNVEVPAEAWALGDLPAHLTARIALTDPAGREVCSGRDPALLRREGLCRIDDGDRALQALRRQWERDGITAWDFADLPEALPLTSQAAGDWVVYPALCVAPDARAGLQVRILRNARRARQAHRQGVQALFEGRFRQELTFLRRQLTLPADLRAAAAPFGGAAELRERFLRALGRRLLRRDIRTREAFEAHAARTAARLLPAGRELFARGLAVIAARAATLDALTRLARANPANPAARDLLAELARAVERLVPVTFLDLYTPERLEHLPRYLDALLRRARRRLENPSKDDQKAALVRPFERRLAELLAGLAPDASEARRDAVEAFFWLLEEYKVSLFAQELKTPRPVSAKRLEAQLAALARLA